MTEEPIDLTMPVGTTPMDHSPLLDDDQARRAVSLSIARPLLMGKGGAFSGTAGPDVSDLIRLAGWIVDGEQEPLYPFTDAEAVVHLGPKITMRPDGYLYVNGDLYERSETEDDS